MSHTTGFERDLNRWREIVATARAGRTIVELGQTGYAVLSRDAGSAGDSSVSAVVRRQDAEPNQLRLLNRIISRATSPDPTARYATSRALLADIDAVLEHLRVPESRAAGFETLARAVHASRHGSGRVIAVLGESGVGKTHLFRDLSARMHRPGDTWTYGKSPQAGTGPYVAYASVLQQLLRTTAELTGTTPSELLETVLNASPLHGGVAGILRHVLTDEELAAGQAGTAHTRNDQFIDHASALAEVLSELARSHERGAVVIAIDDLQWTDTQSLAVFRSLSSAPGRVALFLMGRPEAANRLPPAVGPPVQVSGLTDGESRAMLTALVVGDETPGEASRLLPWISQHARGNPLAIIETVQNARQIRSLSADFAQHDIAEESISTGLETVPSRVKALVETLSLLFPPVPRRFIRAMGELDGSPAEEVLTEALRTGLLEEDVLAEEIRFRHDAVETVFRRRAFSNAQRPGDAVALLRDRVDTGDRRALYVLARILADDIPPHLGFSHGTPEGGFAGMLSVEYRVWVLQEASRQALALTVADEALRFAERALSTGGERLETEEHLTLHELAHEAAFLSDDGLAMSRHFRSIYRRASGLTVNRLRTRWISRSYANLWIRGAVQVGWKVLGDLGAIEDASLDDESSRVRQIDAARRFLAWNSPRSVYRRVMGTAPDGEPTAELVVTTCGMLLLPMLTIDPGRIVVLAHIILREALRHGPSPHAGTGFLMWALLVSQRDGPLHVRYRLGTFARSVADASPENPGRATARHTIYSYSAVFCLHWQVDHRELAGELHTLHEQGMRLANYEWASHAAHIYCQSLFFGGEPLSTVFATMQFYRNRMEEVGIRRVATALGKFQQAAECLLGSTEDPMELTGSITNDAALLEEMERSEDILGYAGYVLLKGLLAAYGGHPERDFENWKLFLDRSASVNSLYPVTVVWFLYGLAAWQNGEEAIGRRALRQSRRFGTRASGPHRIRALAAERSRFNGRHRRAEGLYRRASREAVEDGFPNEAALITERLGTLHAEHGHASAAAVALHTARSLYLGWEAAPAARRMEQLIEGLGPTPPIMTAEPRALPRLPRDTGRTEKALARTREYAQLLFATVQDALLLVGSESRVLFYNLAAQSYLTINPDESAELRQQIRHAVETLIRDAAAEGTQQERELRMGDKTVVAAASPAPPDAHPGVVAVVLRDVSALRERERELVVADRMASLGMLASTIAHEVGNPNHILQLNAQTLQLIMGQLDAGQPAGEPLEQARGAVENIVDGTYRIDEVVRQVTKYAREGHSEVWEYLDPDAICRRVLRFTRLMVAQYTNAVIYRPEAPLPRVHAVRGRLEQALINLIKNACEALPNRDAKVELRVCGLGNGDEQSGPDHVCFAVGDQGPGIHGMGIVEADGTVAAPFQSTREQGTGLGLSIVNTIVEQHHGTFRFTSNSEYASIAEILIPVGRG